MSRQRGVVGEKGASVTGSGAGAVLLLHVEELKVGESDGPALTSGNDIQTHDMGSLTHGVSYDNMEKTTSKLPVATPEKDNHRASNFAASLRLYNSFRKRRGIALEAGMEKNTSINRIIELKRENQYDTTTNEKPSLKPIRRRRRLDYLFSYIDENLPRRDLILLSDDKLDGDRVPLDLERVYEEAVDAVQRVTSAASARAETADFTFHVYRRAGMARAWTHVGSFATASTLSLDDARDWLTEVRAPNATDAFRRLDDEKVDGERREAGASAVAAALSAGAGVALAAVAALVARWAAVRRRRRRRGGDAVLSPADFSFPADERRCVGDGMETMLSCWLQQLHEFGGPELERPDLLKQPPVTHAPSAPSSTCSVNRIAFDRRVRYKVTASPRRLYRYAAPNALYINPNDPHFNFVDEYDHRVTLYT